MKTQLLKDKVLRSDDKGHLILCSEYAIKLMKENLNNYKTLASLSSLGVASPTVEDANNYLDFFMYTSHLKKIINSFIKDIHDRPSNSSLMITLMSVDDDETKLREKYSNSIKRVKEKLSPDDKREDRQYTK